MSNSSSVKPYKTASQMIWKMSPAERDYSLKLDWNEATIMPSPEIKKALLHLLLDEEFYQFYPAVYNEELLEALADYARISQNNVQYFVGSDTLHEYIARCWIKEKDKVLLLWPTYDNFRFTAEIAGAELMFYYVDEDFNVDAESFRQMIKKSPCLYISATPIIRQELL